MTGPEHYREAEELSRRARAVEPEQAMLLATLAQAHATLAKTAAAVDVGGHWDEWRQTIGVPL